MHSSWWKTYCLQLRLVVTLTLFVSLVPIFLMIFYYAFLATVHLGIKLS
jgi:hypothetical protein